MLRVDLSSLKGLHFREQKKTTKPRQSPETRADQMAAFFLRLKTKQNIWNLSERPRGPRVSHKSSGKRTLALV